MKYFLLVLCCMCLSTVQAKELALSFDDGLDPILDQQAGVINHSILDTLAQYQIQAIMFPAINKIGGENGRSLIELWGQQGHRIGNHSASHLNLNKDDVSLSVYLEGVIQGHAFFNEMEGFVPRFRFPFLKEGNTVQKRDGVREWLNQHNYASGAVSIDASDWYYNQLFLEYKKKNNQESLLKLKQAYIAHLLSRAEYYDELAEKTIGRSPKHVLLLHVRAINAEWLDEIIPAFQQEGWQFIDSDTAYQDPLYSIQLNTLPAGESLIWSIASVYGVPNLRYPAEDAVYEYENLKNFGLLTERK